MTTQYTPILKLALPVTGELSGTWGDVVNDNITSMVEQAIAGLATISTWTGNSHTLTTANGTTSESRCAMLVAQDGAGLTAAGEIVCPASSKLYVLKNDTSYTITLKTAAGTGVAVASGNTAFLFCDGTNVNACVTTIVDGRVTGNLTVDGNATINGNTTLGNATSDTITATARFNTDLLPSTDNARDLGSTANSWKDLYIDGTATMALVAISGGTINGVSIGATTPATFIAVDNLSLDGNTIASTNTNGNVVIAPNGTGDVQLDADTVRVGDSGAAATLTSNGAGALTVTTGGAADLTLSTNSGTTSGTIVIANGAGGNITLTPDGTGDVILSADRVQIGDANTDATLTTNGTGNLNLSTNNGTNSGTIQIAQGANGNITLTPNGTGSVSVPKLVWSNGTATRVPYLTTGGQFTDSANLTFNGTDLTVSGAVNAGSVNATTLDLTNLEVTNIKAKDGTASITIADSTGAVSFANNVTLGDASTDTVQVNGHMGVGGAASGGISVYARNTALTGTSQVGFQSQITATSASTTGVYGLYVVNSTEAASFTVGNAYGVRVANLSLGAGSAATNQHGLHIADLTSATNNYGITSLVSSGSNKWNIYASGTAQNYFAGYVGIRTTSPEGFLHVAPGSAAAASTAGAPIILQAQTGGSSASGGNILIGSGQNGSGGSNGYIAFGVGSSTSGSAFATGEAARFDASGRFLVNFNSAIYTNSKIQATASAGPTLGIQQTTNTEYVAGFWNNSATAARKLVAFFYGSSGSQHGSIESDGTTMLYYGAGGNGISINSSGYVGTGTVTTPTFSTSFSATNSTVLQVANQTYAHGQLRVGGNTSSAIGLTLDYNNGGATTSTIRAEYGSSSANAALYIDSGFVSIRTGTSFGETARFYGGTTGSLAIGTTGYGPKLNIYGTNANVNTTVGASNQAMLLLVSSEPNTANYGPEIVFANTYSAPSTIVSSSIAGTKTPASGSSADQYNGNLVFKTSSYPAGLAQKAILDYNGNLGLGTGSPAGRLHVNGENGPLRISGGGYVVNPTEFTLGLYSTNIGYLQVPGTTGRIDIWDGGTGAAVIFNAYGVGLYGTPPTSGSGVTFPSTQQASSNANTLDDYEEGTFTATVTAETSGTITLNAGVNLLAYTKIGRVVYVQGLLEVSSVSSPVGAVVFLQNLPFTIADLTEYAGRIGTAFPVGAAARAVKAYEGETRVEITIDASTISNGTQFYVSFNYIAA